MQLSAFVVLACVLAASARPISGSVAKVDSPVVVDSAVNKNIVEVANNVVGGKEHGERGRGLKRTSPTKARRDSKGSIDGTIISFLGDTNFLLRGTGRGVAGAAGGTAQTADLSGDAVAALLHTVGGVAANTEQGAGVAVANAGYAFQQFASGLEDNSGLAGNIFKTVAGRKRLTRRRGDVGAHQTRLESSAPADTYLSDAEDDVDGKVGSRAGQRKRLTRRRGDAGTRRTRRDSIISDAGGAYLSATVNDAENIVGLGDSGADEGLQAVVDERLKAVVKHALTLVGNQVGAVGPGGVSSHSD